MSDHDDDRVYAPLNAQTLANHGTISPMAVGTSRSSGSSATTVQRDAMRSVAGELRRSSKKLERSMSMSSTGSVDTRDNSDKNCQVFVACLVLLVAGVGQGMLLPLLLEATVEDNGEHNTYFVYMWVSFLFVVIYGIASYYDYKKGTLTMDMMKQYVKPIILMGICDGVNRMLTIYTSSLGRTDGNLQAILLQSMIPYTVLFTRMMTNDNISRNEYKSIGVVIAGIVIGMIPNIIHLAEGDTTENVLFPLFFLLAVAPASLIGVLQLQVFMETPTYCLDWMLFFESAVQLVMCVLFFWADIIPGFGTSANIVDFFASFGYGIECAFGGTSNDKCAYATLFAILYSLCFCLTYWCYSYIICNGSAIFASLVVTIIAPMIVVAWSMFPSLTEWAGGEDYDTLDIVIALLTTILLIAPGTVAYKHYENVRQTDDKKDPLINT